MSKRGLAGFSMIVHPRSDVYRSDGRIDRFFEYRFVILISLFRVDRLMPSVTFSLVPPVVDYAHADSVLSGNLP